MKLIVVEKDIKLMAIKAKSFPHGIQEAWKELESKISSKRGKKFYGILQTAKSNLNYYACVNRNEVDTYQISDQVTIKKGRYLAKEINSWQSDTTVIENTFMQLFSQDGIDDESPFIEFYKSKNTLVCMVLMKEIDQIKYRPLELEERNFLSEMLYEAIFIPQWHEKPSKSIIQDPSLAKYIEGWPKDEFDKAFVAEIDGNLIGAIWGRKFDKFNRGFGYVDDEIPELSMALKPSFRNQGIGSQLLILIINSYKGLNVDSLSLSVDKANPANRLYKKHGFQIVKENETAFTMVLNLCQAITINKNNIINKCSMEDKTIAGILTSQYKASLGALRQTLDKIPEEQWNTEEYSNANWQIAYHILWATKYYLGDNSESYIPFENAIEGAESLGGSQEWENTDENVTVKGVHTKEELILFIDHIKMNLDQNIESLPLKGDSGFEWYPYSRLELHINNIRHIQHHTAQIIERLKAKGITDFPWWADQNPPQGW